MARSAAIDLLQNGGDIKKMAFSGGTSYIFGSGSAASTIVDIAAGNISGQTHEMIGKSE